MDTRITELKQDEKVLDKLIEYDLPMVTSAKNMFSELIQIREISLAEENIVGVKLPVLKALVFNRKHYSYFNTPQWIEKFIEVLQKKIELKLLLQISIERQRLLSKAIQTVTQRKNLFEKVLIPKALNNIRLIQIFLSDNERAAVVRSKIAKKKRIPI
ncbi:V-type ATP synthase subunit D [Legionella parisiensis]|uniref:V-type ATP synthase subunit D n=1 Tax=Legionella parisiensis TaxID=45071 RepID=UPI0030B81339